MTYDRKDSETGRNTGKSGPLNILLFIVLFLALICISLFVYLKSQNISLKDISLKSTIEAVFSSKAGEDGNNRNTREIKYESSERPAFAVYNGYIIKCMRDSVKGFGKNGEEEWTVPVSVSNPFLKAVGKNLLVADIGGKDIYLLDGKSIKWNKKLDNNIISVDLNKDGYIAVTHEAKGYRGQVSVYNQNGNEILSRTVFQNFPLSAKVLPSARQLVINSINASGIKATTGLTYVNMNASGFKDIVPREDMMFPVMWSLDNGLLAAVSQSSVIAFSNVPEEKWKYELKDNKIYCSDILDGKNLVLAVSRKDDEGNLRDDITDIKILDKDGEVTSEFSIEDKIKNIKVYGHVIGLNTGRVVYFVNQKGSLLDKCTSNTEVSEVFFVSGQEVVLITKNKIIINSINT
jgi:hypothetical protein